MSNNGAAIYNRHTTLYMPKYCVKALKVLRKFMILELYCQGNN